MDKLTLADSTAVAFGRNLVSAARGPQRELVDSRYVGTEAGDANAHATHGWLGSSCGGCRA